MTKIIQKLNKLKNTESFIQINTVKGFKYVDKAGEIVNSFCKGDIAPIFTMGLNGLVIEEPRPKILEFKVTPQIVWAKFVEVDSLDMVSDLFSKEVTPVLNILEVTKLSRIGWRNYFIHEFQKQVELDEYLKKFISLSGVKTSMIKFEIVTNQSFKANLSIQPVIKTDEAKTPGILFDIDVFCDQADASDLSKLLKQIRNYLADENGFLKIVNNTFS